MPLKTEGTPQVCGRMDRRACGEKAEQGTGGDGDGSGTASSHRPHVVKWRPSSDYHSSVVSGVGTESFAALE